jgi:hypothetical protein
MTTRFIVKSLLKGWNETRDAALPRNELRKLASAAGKTLEDYVENIFASDGEGYHPVSAEDYDPAKFPMRAYANYVLSKGYTGQYMRDERDAERWIRTMAKGRTDEHDLNEDGMRFWKAIRSKFGLWITEKEMATTKQNAGEG